MVCTCGHGSDRQWIPVTCPFCEGTGQHPEQDWFTHPNSFRYVTCLKCHGKRILLARPVEYQEDNSSESRTK